LTSYWPEPGRKATKAVLSGMSPGGGVSVPAGAAPAWDDAGLDEVACGAGVLAGLLQALAQSAAAARTASLTNTVALLALLMAWMLRARV
jgi:hypothetical protein